MMQVRAAGQTTIAMRERWRELAAMISRSDGGVGRTEDGSLTILGSGIAHMDLTIADEEVIRRADHVFHCLYDRVTQAWIQELCPNAFDLRILYDPTFSRHDTYICMAEAMLYHVRRGANVVGIYYGHPGIFATPTHRAVKVARKEGYRATMRPGISALDYMVADVGFDPMIPGLISFEASDLLLCRRRLDPSLHTVLWQVGAVGELGFSPSGFENKLFGLLVDYLLSQYDRRSTVVHYVAPQYAGIDPLIECYQVEDLRSPDVRARVTALSTFYLPPSAYSDRGAQPTASEPGLRPDPTSVEPGSREFDFTSYGEIEAGALRRFREFSIPDHYSAVEPSPAMEFVRALSTEPGLRDRYRKDPVKVLDEARWAHLTSRVRALLAIPHPRSFNAAIASST